MPLAARHRRVVLTQRPHGIPGPEHFAIEAVAVPDLAADTLLVRNRYLSVDPAMRGWVNAAANYSQPVEIGEVMRSLAVGEVVDSADPRYPPGECVMGMFGWQEYALVQPEAVWRTVPERDLPLSYALGVLGLGGLTAWAAVGRVLTPRSGETVVVSTAAGGVGSLAGQLAGLSGCRTVGIAGGPQKVRRCLEEFGFDAAVDYRSAQFDDDLEAATPDGVDAYMDHTGGAVTDAVLRRLAVGARVAVVGTAAVAAWDPWPSGPRVERILLTQRASMQGFLAFDHLDGLSACVAELSNLLRQGRLVYREHVLDGLEAAPGAIGVLYRGENTGKLIVRLTP